MRFLRLPPPLTVPVCFCALLVWLGAVAVVAPSFADDLKAGAAAAAEAEKAAPKKHRPQTIRLFVVGDSLADGLWAGLYRHFIREPRIKVIRETLNSSGFTAYDWQSRLEKLLRTGKVDIIVAQMGTNDHQRLIRRKRPLPSFKSPEWMEAYRGRVEQFMMAMKDAKVAAFWVGLPVMRKKQFNADSQMLNDIYRSVAQKLDVPFVSTWSVTSGPAGEFVAFFRDESGRRRRLRADDGIHFTEKGYDRVAQHVLKVIRERRPDLMPPDLAERKEKKAK